MATGDGVVVHSGWKEDGFGYSVVIKDKRTGLFILYGHNSKNIVKEGQTVKAGQVIGKVGDTGASRGAHLHFQVMSDYASYTTVNPEVVLAVGSGMRQPGVAPARTAGVSAPPMSVPRGAVRLADGTWTWGGKVFDQNGLIINSKQTGTAQYPTRTNVMKTTWTRADIKPPNATNNYGYDYMNVTKNPQNRAFVQGLHRVAYNLGIPAVVLADIIDVETSWRLNSINSTGHAGIIQFSEETKASLERRLGRKFNVNDPVSQLPFLELYLNEFKGKYKNAEDIAAQIFGGAPLYWKNAKQRESFRDGNNVSFPVYMQRMGTGAGRRYQTSYDSATPQIHALYNQGCPTCNSLLSAGAFSPHYSGLT